MKTKIISILLISFLLSTAISTVFTMEKKIKTKICYTKKTNFFLAQPSLRRQTAVFKLSEQEKNKIKSNCTNNEKTLSFPKVPSLMPGASSNL